MKRSFKNFQMTIIFLIIWIILNENARLPTLIIGIFISSMALHLTNRLLKINYAEKFYMSPIKLILYSCLLVKEIYLSGYDLVRRIISGNIKPTFIEYESSLSDQLTLTLLSNSFTLPPGGVTVSRQDNHLTILSANDNEEAVRKEIERFENKVRWLEKKQKRFEKKLKGILVSNKQ